MGASSGVARAQIDSINATVELVSRRGLLFILAELAYGSLRHNELARATGMDSKQLTRALRRALQADLINRHVETARMPVGVHYQLTARGKELITALAPLADWWERTDQAAADVSTDELDENVQRLLPRVSRSGE